jgi:hypothetical protein
MRVIFALALLAAYPASANVNTMLFATEIGVILGSDEACGLAFNQDSVRAYILANTSADDLSAPNMIATMVQGNRIRLKSEKPFDLAIHCDLVTRSAQALGLLK